MDMLPPAKLRRPAVRKKRPREKARKLKHVKDANLRDARMIIKNLKRRALKCKADLADEHCPEPPSTISLGSDCSGIGSEMFALDLLNVSWDIVFCSENDVKVRRLHEALHKHGGTKRQYLMYSDIDPLKSGPAAEPKPKVDLYVAGPPCQSFSSLGVGRGVSDSRGAVIEHVLKYIREAKPRCAVIENVKGLTTAKHVRAFAEMLLTMEKAGYSVTWNIMDTKTHGIPQSRPRMYIVAIRGVVSTFKWPQDLKVRANLDPFLCAQAPSRVKCLTSRTSKEAVEKATRKLKAQGLLGNGLTTLVDIHASKRYVTVRQDVCPCITATRGRQGGFYIMSQKRMTTLEELGRLQGFPTAAVSSMKAAADKGVVGHALGNAMSVNILLRILPRVLHAAGLIGGCNPPSDWLKHVKKKEWKSMELLPDHFYDRIRIQQRQRAHDWQGLNATE